MNFLEALLYGLIQGITEFLPVSSSGHLSLLGRILQTDEAAMMSFTTLLHMGTLIAVFIVMRREIGDILHDLLGPRTWQLVIATIPAVLVAVLLGDWVDSLFAGNTLGYEFLITGVILASSLCVKQNRAPRDIGYKESLIAGVGQAVAIAPAISRSGTTLTALLFCGVDRDKAIRFSFLMSIPAILGGFVLDLKDMIQGQGAALSSFGAGNILVGVAAAAVSGWLAMNFMLRKLTRRGFLYCAVYVIALGILILIDQTFTHFVFA